MKFLFATDTHLKGKNPANRIDDFPTAMLTKLSELCAVAKAEGAEAILHGGDLFDVPDVSNRLIGEVGQIIRSCGVPFYVVPGNHDLYGYNMASLPQTALGVLAKTGVVHILDRASGGVVFQGPDCWVAVQGQEYYADIDKGINNDYRFDPVPGADHKILIPHSMLLKDPFYPGIPHTLTKDVVTDADLILVGHYHPGFDDHTIGRTRFINPGSMGRLDATQATIGRPPRYLIITAEAQKPLLVEFREFKTARPGIEVLDPTMLDLRKKHAQQFEEFKQNIQQASVAQGTNVKDVLLSLAQVKGLPKDVVDLAQDQLLNAELNDKATTDADGFEEKNHHVQIAKVELENFQSHEHTIVEFGEGLNAIIGPSDSGKSSIIRALRWVLYNEPKGADFIRHGANTCRVRVTFDNGEFIERIRTVKHAGKYIIGKLVQTVGSSQAPYLQLFEYEGFGSQVPIEVMNVSQMPKSNLGRGDSQTLNFRYQLDPPFLIGESPATGAAVIGRLTNVHLVDTAVKQIGQEIARTNAELKHLRQSLKETEDQLAGFTGLKELEQTLKKLDQQYTVLELASERADQLKDLEREITQAERAIDRYSEFIESFENLDAAMKLMEQLEDLREQHEELVDLHNEITRYEHVITRIESKLAQLNYVPEAAELLTELEKIVDEYRSLLDLDDELASAENVIDRIHPIYQKIIEQRNSMEKELNLLLDSLDLCPVCEQPMGRHAHAV
jgi:DNA repair exonuclease SbcCD nuclease subunit/tetratricopeptide (TPR) repeat protein